MNALRKKRTHITPLAIGFDKYSFFFGTNSNRLSWTNKKALLKWCYKTNWRQLNSYTSSTIVHNRQNIVRCTLQNRHNRVRRFLCATLNQFKRNHKLFIISKLVARALHKTLGPGRLADFADNLRLKAVVFGCCCAGSGYCDAVVPISRAVRVWMRLAAVCGFIVCLYFMAMRDSFRVVDDVLLCVVCVWTLHGTSLPTCGNVQTCAFERIGINRYTNINKNDDQPTATVHIILQYRHTSTT